MIETIFKLYPNVAYVNDGIAYDKDQHVVEIDQALIDGEIAKTVYITKRLSEYPTIQEQLDMQYWDAINGTTTWQDAINAVKVKYPKPE